MSVSVVIANRNDTTMLSVTVRSCIEELQGHGEIVIVDNSDDDIYRILPSVIPSGYIRDDTVRIIRQNFPCLFTARETGIKEAKFGNVLCLDSHVIVGHNMIKDLSEFMDRKKDDPDLGFVHAPVNWCHQHENRSRHSRDMSQTELGNWDEKVNIEKRITWKGMPWMCDKRWFIDKLGGYGALSKHNIAWGGGDMHLGVKAWLLGFENWGIPCRPAIHIGPFPNVDGKQTNKYRVYANSGNGIACIGFLISCYVLGGEAMMMRNEGVLAKRFKHMKPREHWKAAIKLGQQERDWLDKRKVMTFERFLKMRPWNSSTKACITQPEKKPHKVAKKAVKPVRKIKVVKRGSKNLRLPKLLPSQVGAGAALKYSIVIAYQHLPKRLPLFNACLDRLIRVIGGRMEICIHEVGKVKRLDVSNRCKYLFTKYDGIFHRAWALNRGVKKLATGDMIVVMDGDLIVDNQWAAEVFRCRAFSTGWGTIVNLSEVGTREFLERGAVDRRTITKTKTPSMGCSAGAITVIPKKLFYEVNAIPEDFAGSWGGEDNAFLAKMNSLGHRIRKFDSEVVHLFHEPTTPRIARIQKKAAPMIKWTKAQWKAHITSVGDSWGRESPDSYTGLVDTIIREGGPRLTFAMLSWLRYKKLMNTLHSLKKTLTIPVNMVVMVQGAERLDRAQRVAVVRAANKFAGSDVFFSEGNIGTGPARKHLVARALDRFDSAYINLADDDTTYTKGSVEAVIDLLDKDPSLGVVGVRYKDKIFYLNPGPGQAVLRDRLSKKDIEYVDVTGSASAFMRTAVFEHCKIDPYYIIGQWDLDLFLQVRSVGWKIANLKAFDGMKAINDHGGCREYKKTRMNREQIMRSVLYFRNKWRFNKRA